MMNVVAYSIRDGLSQKDREFHALGDTYINVYELNWVKVFYLLREYARSVEMDVMFSGQELAVVSLLLSMDTSRPDIRRSLERGDGVQGLRGLLKFCEKELASAQSVAGKELQALVFGLLNGVISDYGPSHAWSGEHVQSALLQAVQMAQERAKILLPDILASGRNEPAISLYAVFARLHERVISQINRLTSRTIQFYYDELLRDTGVAVQPDRVHLVIPISAVDRDICIEKGTGFTAGVDSQGEEILFSSTASVELNDVFVNEIRTLNLESDVPWADQIPTYQPEKIMSESGIKPHPLFGNTRDGVRPITATIPEIGFALSSPILFLQEGSREVRIRFEYESESIKGTVLDPINYAKLTLADRCEAFLRTFKDVFCISYTTEIGWFPIPEYSPSFHLLEETLPEGCVEICIHLPQDAPGVVSYNTQAHGQKWITQLPVLRFLLNPESCEYGASLLQKLVLQQVRIDVTVEDCRKLVLQNQIGPLSTMAPFQPFGPLPVLGDYLLVGCSETLGKSLTDFQVEMEWGALPESVSDFSEWYEGYDGAPYSKNFVVRLSVLVDGRWHPNHVEYPVLARLFPANRRNSAKNRISPKCVISCKSVLPSEKPMVQSDIDREFAFGPITKNGFFKFSLAGPEGAFQHQAYPTLLSKILTSNSRLKSEIFSKPLPKIPYTPVVSSIKAMYKARAFIPMSRIGRENADPCKPTMLHLHPWGWEDVLQSGTRRITQIPYYRESGSLFLGLRTNRIPQSVSLYFHLSRDSEKPPLNARMLFTWWYLSDQGWTPLPAKSIQIDTTNHFTCSGIISVLLPADMVSQHSLMPEGSFWIRVNTEKKCDFCCRIFSVFAQAVEAERTSMVSASFFKHLPSGSITKMSKSLSGVSGVFQIAPSWGGRLLEKKAHQKTRIAERLYHKHRAFSPSDYERLVLEAFPQVFKAKCFSGIDPEFPDRLTPGHLVFVPVSYLFSDGRKQWKPKLAGHMLFEIEEYLKPLMPPSAILHVINPYFEKIQVRCVVRFRGKQSSGLLLKKLNSDICNFISPWYESGYQTHFGWCARKHDLEAFIQEQEYVESVSDCSLLRVSPTLEHQYLMDESSDCCQDEFRGAFPWSVAVPMRKHYINVLDSGTEDSMISVGIGDLEIGRTFILQAGKSNDENE